MRVVGRALFFGVFALLVATAPACHCSRAGGGSSSAADDLKIEDLVVGAGPEAVNGARVSIHYSGWLGKAMFDTTKNRQPLIFHLGKGEVLRGWDQGIVGMKVGGRRRLTVPPELGFGKKGSLAGAIPPDSVLVFEIELLSVAT